MEEGENLGGQRGWARIRGDRFLDRLCNGLLFQLQGKTVPYHVHPYIALTNIKSVECAVGALQDVRWSPESFDSQIIMPEAGLVMALSFGIRASTTCRYHARAVIFFSVSAWYSFGPQNKATCLGGFKDCIALISRVPTACRYCVREVPVNYQRLHDDDFNNDAHGPFSMSKVDRPASI